MEPTPVSGEPASADHIPAHGALRPTAAERAVALLEVLLCSDYPTQIVIAQALMVAGFHQRNGDGSLNITFISTLSLVDAAVLVGLIVLFLVARGERPRRVLFGDKPPGREALAGVPLMFVSLLIAVGVLLSVQLLAPSLRNTPHNPLQDLLNTPRHAVIFGIVVVIAGGVREEIQRAFLLHRFERFLGGDAVGLIIVSVAFGSGHYIQGWDAVLATGVLGAFWGVTYLRRRSAVAPMVAHAGFNVLQLAQFFAIGR